MALTPTERSDLYVKRYPERRQLTMKLMNIRRQYGEAARAYFEGHPRCEVCDERRLACLALHHREGKEVESFQVLCHNCHAVEHNGAYTFEQATEGRAALGIARARPPATHGTATMYRRGCRCEPCSTAHRAAYRAWEERRKVA